jgi:catecholate siderophore receptor
MPRQFCFPSPHSFLLGGVAYRALAVAALGLSTLCVVQPAKADDAVSLPEISVQGAAPNDYQPGVPSLPKLTEPLRDTPQSITVVPRQVIEDKGVTSMTDTLRSVPGVSLQAGEAGNQGDNLSLRGFNARNDIFLDGMRDFGSYYRDSFNYESVEVLKGPSSVLFGRGSTGGVVNQVSKTAHLGNDNLETFSLGTNDLVRSTADVNHQLSDTSAFRLNVMANKNGVADRDEAEFQRYGVAASLAFGLGTSTRTTFNYLHQTETNTPDYGVPWLFGRPAKVDRSNYYGFSDGSNYLDTTADIATAKIEHDIDGTTSVRNQTRLAYYTRKLRITEAQILGSPTPSTPLDQITVDRKQISSESQETFIQNQTDVTKKFDTGAVQHTAVGGLEIGRETSAPLRLTYTGVPTTNLANPDPSQPFTFATANLNSNTTTTATSAAAYVIDTAKLSPQWDLIGGLRYDYFNSHNERIDSSGTATQTNRVDTMPSYRAALVYKPVEIGSIYAAYGTSFNPSAESLSVQAANANVDPEENTTYEVGTKWDLFGERMSFRSAVYQLEKTNARVPDPDNTGVNTLDGAQRVRGLEAEVAGRITDEWQVYGGYNFMMGQVTKTSDIATNAQPGAPLTNTPRHTVSVWSTYDIAPQWQVGGGVNYVSSRYARNTGAIESVPSYTTVDAMAKYRLTENVSLQVNLYNLFDEEYYDLLHPSHVVPGAGRTIMFTTSFKL